MKVRSLAPAVSEGIEDDWVSFAEPEYGVAPGEAAGVFDRNRVLGGGWIAETASIDARVPDVAAA